MKTIEEILSYIETEKKNYENRVRGICETTIKTDMETINRLANYNVAIFILEELYAFIISKDN